ncbi:SCO family protein [Allohahella sp. A8]|uniref:SCO family protein n=1 Tax=Allohahella sp. A8 TaxID=3141461 RepID=UPI003A80219D
MNPGFVFVLFLLFSSHSAAAASPSGTDSTSSYPWQHRLINHEGQSFSLADYNGQTVLYSFFYTGCSSICPTQTYELTRIQQLLPDALKLSVQFVSVSVDPTTDFPETIKAYAQRFGIDFTNWQFSTTRDEHTLRDLLGKMRVQVVEAPESGEIDHSPTLFLVDRSGRIIQRYLSTRIDTQRIAQDIAAADRIFR